MKSALWLLLLTLLGLSVFKRLEKSPTPGPQSSLAQDSCAISTLPDGACPTLAWAPVASMLPSQMPNLQKAYFSMGCFWGSEAMLASCPGVIFTQVGFTGGDFPNPSYSAIGDHVETVEVTFDPTAISYKHLLDHFWKHHNARAKPIFRQYASAIFTTSTDQETLAKEARSRISDSASSPILTAIIPLVKFYPADQGHQKHYLSQDPDLLDQMPREGRDKLMTRLATKLNAVAGQAGDQADLLKSLLDLGVPNTICEALLRRANPSAK